MNVRAGICVVYWVYHQNHSLTLLCAISLPQSNKPLMEKRRRERINNCLDQLKAILMEVTKKEVKLATV